MPSGYAYGKALRTVKTCVGETFCRFGTGDAMGVGIELEKRFERLNTPAKVKLAVSGCPRNCAESGIKDLGVVSVDGGWELYAGGNGGVKVRVGDLLALSKRSKKLSNIQKLICNITVKQVNMVSVQVNGYTDLVSSISVKLYKMKKSANNYVLGWIKHFL